MKRKKNINKRYKQKHWRKENYFCDKHTPTVQNTKMGSVTLLVVYASLFTGLLQSLGPGPCGLRAGLGTEIGDRILLEEELRDVHAASLRHQHRSPRCRSGAGQ